MANQAISIDVSELNHFFDLMESAGNTGFKNELKKFMEGIGNEFLRIVEDEIIRRNALDTRLLLNSFHKGDANNVWVIQNEGLTLEVGTNVEYASYVNDGHWTNPSGVATRWVPGYWNGDRFVYSPGAKTGMLLKQKWIEGKHYWEAAIRIIDQLIPRFVEAKLDAWLRSYFGV